MTRPWLLVLVLGGIAAATVLWFGYTHERGTERHYRPPSAEAVANRFLAAQRLLERFDIQTRRDRRLDDVAALPHDAVLIVAAPRGAVSARAVDAVDAFVRRGGRLIVESEDSDAHDALLDHFGIERIDDDALPGYRSDTIFWNNDVLDSDDWSHVEPTFGALGEPELAVRLGGPHWLRTERDTAWKLGEDAVGDAHALQLAHGDGRVTVLNAFGPFTNWQIGDVDHAEYLHRLVTREGAPSLVVFAQSDRVGLFAWLAANAWRALLAAALLIVALLWAAAPRFGPVAPDPEPVRRRVLDHLRASGRLLSSLGERDALAAAARGAVLRRVRREYAHTIALTPHELHDFLRRRFALDAREAGLLLSQGGGGDAGDFVALLRTCRRVHQMLSRRRGSDPLYDT